jgi:hypothetical protein
VSRPNLDWSEGPGGELRGLIADRGIDNNSDHTMGPGCMREGRGMMRGMFVLWIFCGSRICKLEELPDTRFFFY